MQLEQSSESKTSDQKPHRLTGGECAIGRGAGTNNLSVLNFWQWAYSDLKANNVRGVFAEWLVSMILGVPQPVRDSWEAWDLTIEGVKVEVKSGAYVQTWHDENSQQSKIIFSGLKAKTWNSDVKQYSENKGFNADIYVFCLQTCQSRLEWNALNLDQWRFFVLDRCVLVELNCNSLSLSQVKAGGELDAAGLRDVLHEKIRLCKASKTDDTPEPWQKR